MSVPEELSRAVRTRANGRCQYCLMHESLQGATFHLEHIIPRCKGGRSDLENLAVASTGRINREYKLRPASIRQNRVSTALPPMHVQGGAAIARPR